MGALFSIIVPIFDPFDRSVALGAVQRTLSRALRLNGSFELVVVNNNPIRACPHLTEWLRLARDSFAGIARLVETDENLGTAGGFNAGLRVANSESSYVVFMSQDCDIVDQGTLQRAELVLEEDPRIGIGHPYSVYEDAKAFNVSRKYNLSAFRRSVRCGTPISSADIPDYEVQQILKVVARRRSATPTRSFPLTFAVLRRELLERVGSFDEGVQIGCSENDDLAYRARLGGFEVSRLDGVFVNHRRLLFRHICVGGTPLAAAAPHQDALEQSGEWWRRKWGRPYVELYAQLRLGPTLFGALAPYFVLRRFAGRIRRGLFPESW